MRQCIRRRDTDDTIYGLPHALSDFIISAVYLLRVKGVVYTPDDQNDEDNNNP